MKKLAFAVLALVGFASVNAGNLATQPFVTVLPNGNFKVLAAPDPNCGQGPDIVCQIQVDGSYAVGATIPASTSHQTLQRKPL